MPCHCVRRRRIAGELHANGLTGRKLRQHSIDAEAPIHTAQADLKRTIGQLPR